jgi:hypothetical protein
MFAMLIEIISPAPILNIPDFVFAFGGNSGSEIPLNAKGHPYCFEFVALKGMTFEVEKTNKSGNALIHKIMCETYPKRSLYVDTRFAKPASRLSPKRVLPEAEAILSKMLAKIGTPYVWGGNWSDGIPEMLDYYPAKKPIDDHTAKYWTLSGLDCSGLLYEATEGAAPRNTSQLIHYGQPVPLGSNLRPLDMIVYPGHVVFVANPKFTVESKFPFGVILRDLPTRIWEFDAARKRVEEWDNGLDPNRYYTIRRFT